MVRNYGKRTGLITREDVARQAGVSGGTVSLALRDDPRIKASTRQLIQAVARQMQYQPLASARALRAGRTNTIGVVFPWLVEYQASNVAHAIGFTRQAARLLKIYSTALQAISSTLIQNRYHLSLAAAEEIREVESHQLRARLFEESSVDGVLMIQSPNTELTTILARQNLPYVVLDGWPAPHRPCVCVRTDHRRAAEMAVEHLVSLGHKRIAKSPITKPPFRSPEYVEGYLRAMAAAGLSPVPGWDETKEAYYHPWQINQNYYEKLFKRPEPPTALLATNDQEAVGVISWLMAHGKNVPKDVSVAALHDTGFAEEIPEPRYVPELTCKANMQAQEATLAVEKLLALIENPAEPVESAILEPRLVIGESTGPCPQA